MKQKINPKASAASEINWWDKYHRRDWEGLEQAVKELRKKQFGVEIDDEAAKHFCDAAKSYISYKKALSEGDESSAKGYLMQAEEHIEAHYDNIKTKLKFSFLRDRVEEVSDESN